MGSAAGCWGSGSGGSGTEIFGRGSLNIIARGSSSLIAAGEPSVIGKSSSSSKAEEIEA